MRFLDNPGPIKFPLLPARYTTRLSEAPSAPSLRRPPPGSAKVDARRGVHAPESAAKGSSATHSPGEYQKYDICCLLVRLLPKSCPCAELLLHGLGACRKSQVATLFDLMGPNGTARGCSCSFVPFLCKKKKKRAWVYGQSWASPAKPVRTVAF